MIRIYCHKRGFSLFELTVAVRIKTTLSAIAASNFIKTQMKKKMETIGRYLLALN